MKHKSEKIVNNKYKQYLLIVGFVALLGITNIGTFYVSSQKEKNESVSNFQLLNPARNLVDQKDLIINFQPLRDYLNEKYESDPNVSVYLEYLPTGANIAISKDAEFYPASLLKVPVAMAVAKKIDNGDWKWGSKLVLMSGDKDDKYGTLYKEPTGTLYTIEELVRRSLVDSDNTAHFMLLRNLELAEINAVYKHMGLDGFLESNGTISAKRYSVILRALYNASYLTEDSSEKIISFMSEDIAMEFIGSGIPRNIKFAHKIGVDINKKIYLDSGIIYLGSRRYVLIVMTKSKTADQAKSIMKDISAKTFEYIKEYK